MLLEVENLQMRIRLRTATVQAVDGVSLSLSAGETLGLVGESGCGKSMTAMSIMRLLPPGGEITGGHVRLNGRDLLALSGSQMRQVRGDEIAMVFQDPMTSLNPTKTVGEQIAEPLQIHRHQSKGEATRRAVEMLGLVGMPKPAERLNDYPHQLSGGLRQRAMIAMALACEPKLLIADEPTTALDVTIQDQILTLLGRLTAELGMGLLLITHDMGVIASRADRVMVMYAGRIVESGATGTLFSGARHHYSRALLASIPDLKTDKSKVLASIPGLPPDLAHPPPACRFAPRCNHAQPRCEEEDPALLGGDPDHQFACFYPVQPDAGRSRAETGVQPGSAGIVVSAPLGPADGECSDAALLVVEHVVKEFPVTKGVLQRKTASVKAVSDVSIGVSRGQTLGLVGESGCGKTTLGRLIIGLERPDSGTIRFDGEDLSKLRGGILRRRRQHFQLMFQDPYSSLDPRMRVGSILREPLMAQGLGSRRDRERRIRELLVEVGLGASAADLYPHEFSGGQRQRIGLARALILEPKLIVADEPVSALDVSIQAQILNLMKRLQAERDLAYVLISHDLSVVRYLADQIGVMYLGKLVEIGAAADVYERPAHPYTAGLLKSVPVPDPARARKGGEAAISGELPSSVNPPSGCRFRTRCPLAQDICAKQEPPLRSFHVASHQAACHFPLQIPRNPLRVGGTASCACVEYLQTGALTVTAYLIRRVLQALVVLFGVSLIVFIMIHLLPGGPRAMLGLNVRPAVVHAFIVANGYNKPIWIQYVAYIDHVVHGNFGYSYTNNETVLLLLQQNLPKSGLLVGLSAVASLIVAVPLGLLQAIRRNKPVDYVLTAGAFIGYSMPLFWLGTLLILVFAVNTHLFPPQGPQGSTVATLLNQPRALVLPVATLAIVTIALWSRYMRSSAVDNLVQDYIRTARAKGASETRVLFGHLLRNALLPIITLIGLSLPAVLSGEVITESVFNYPGMGLLSWNAATTHDYPVLMGVTIVVGAAVVAGSLLADILYAVVDPRVRYS